jgi:hypothetical protein
MESGHDRLVSTAELEDEEAEENNEEELVEMMDEMHCYKSCT